MSVGIPWSIVVLAVMPPAPGISKISDTNQVCVESVNLRWPEKALNGAVTVTPLISGFWLAAIKASRPSKCAPLTLSLIIVAVALIVPKNLAMLGNGRPTVKLLFDAFWI